MKKNIVVGVIAVAVLSTSCRKERTCECKTTETTVRTGSGAVTDIEMSSYKLTMSKQKKKEFKLMSNCVSSKEQHTNSGGSGSGAYTEVITTETKCDLK